MSTPAEPNGAENGPQVRRALTFGVPAQAILDAWCDPQVQDRLLGDVATLLEGDAERMRWRLHGPWGHEMTFESRRVDVDAGRCVRHAGSGAHGLQVATALSVQPAPGDFGTEAMLEVGYALPGGLVAEAAAKLAGATPRLLAGRVLRRLKAWLETGEIPTLDRNPSARRDANDPT